MMNSILITGCNRGLGLGLVRQLVRESSPPKYLIATCRNLEKAEELKQVANENKNVYLLELDVKNFDSFEKFTNQVSEIVKTDGLNVLFNNAGVSPKYTRTEYVKAEQLLETFTTNTVAPILLTKAFLPLLKLAAKKNSTKPFGVQKSVIINMSSILGSIANNVDGGLHPYRCSKVALNMATKSMSVDFHSHGILAMALHPGWVRTDMGGTKAPLDVDGSTSAIVKLLGELNETHNGGLYQWDGTKLEY